MSISRFIFSPKKGITTSLYVFFFSLSLYYFLLSLYSVLGLFLSHSHCFSLSLCPSIFSLCNLRGITRKFEPIQPLQHVANPKWNVVLVYFDFSAGRTPPVTPPVGFTAHLCSSAVFRYRISASRNLWCCSATIEAPWYGAGFVSSGVWPVMFFLIQIFFTFIENSLPCFGLATSE